MEVEQKEAYFSYIKELQKLKAVNPVQCAPELMQRFGLNQERADRLVELYYQEEIENKKRLLLE